MQAGFLKRSYPDMPEDSILMRALRDMNMPKFVYEDEPLFNGLLQDLFPGLQAGQVGNEDLKANSAEDLEKNGYGSPDEAHL
jgi:dynein heavy chain